MCTSLHTVYFSQCNQLTDKAAESLSVCPSLHTVNFSYCNQLTYKAAESLSLRYSRPTVNISNCELLSYMLTLCVGSYNFLSLHAPPSFTFSLYTFAAANDLPGVNLVVRRFIKKKMKRTHV